jgi:branched-chain amino acid transport system ATP-binding protein
MIPLWQRKKCGMISSFVGLPGALKLRNEVTEEAYALLKEMSLDEVAHQKASTLPYGRQRKLEISRALAARPLLLMLDEPAAGMNSEETRQLADLIVHMKEKFSLTILLIEHHMDLVMNICDRVAVIDRGKLISSGTPSEVKQDPVVIKAYLGGLYAGK